MGREATCHCQWAGESGQCKVLLETRDLILRGAIRRTAPLAALTGIAAEEGQLRFTIAGEQVSLALGRAQAASWARKLIAPPPTLASKLGIGRATQLQLIGDLDSEELMPAIAGAGSAASPRPNLILALVRSQSDLNHALDVYAAHAANPPLWIVYPKGAGKPIDETEIRGTLRREGFMDTKVASVSATLTALRFVKRS